MLERFVGLFTGSQVGFGQWQSARTPPAATEHGAPTLEHYKRHLSGKIGLGIVPVNGEGLCQFAAIDIDVDTIDHGILFEEVKKRNLPLSVCRSKSGGAHLYVFMKAPGIASSIIRPLLSSWASSLGYPQAEIFPKQQRSSLQNVGNWINLPYFSGDATTRYCVGSEGAKSLEEFLRGVVYYDQQTPITIKADVEGEIMPPCLQELQKQGVGAGFRNQGLLNYAIFYRKSNPKNWEEATAAQNSQYFSPPLDSREVRGIIQSASRNKYQYTCESEPIRSYCNKPLCVTLPFGVGHMPWQESGGHDDLNVGNCRKLLSDPPKYILEVSGKDITLDWENFYNFQKFKSSLGQTLNLVIANRKQVSWEQTVRQLLSQRTDIEAPDDASIMGLVVEKLHEFLVLRERATEKEDLLRGLPIQDGNHVLFRASDFKRYLQGFKLDRVEGSDLFILLRAQGTTHTRIRIGGRMVMAWSFPVSQINEQTEDFKVPDFAKDLKSEV